MDGFAKSEFYREDCYRKILSAHRYILKFVVSDSDHGQRDVKADVTVQVTHLKPQEMRQAAPLTLAASSRSMVQPGAEVGSEYCFRILIIFYAL